MKKRKMRRMCNKCSVEIQIVSQVSINYYFLALMGMGIESKYE